MSKYRAQSNLGATLKARLCEFLQFVPKTKSYPLVGTYFEVPISTTELLIC